MNENDLRVIKTKENITNQLITCLKMCSFKDVSVKMLVDGARINRSTFYRNYEDKYDLLDKLLASLLEEFEMSIDSRFVSMRYKNAREYHAYLEKMVQYFKKIRTLWLSSGMPRCR
jgi:AcrR family transcriptional regulator